MDLGLKGLKALVTGGSKGIGRRCAEILVAEGAEVAICARTEVDVKAVADELGLLGAAVDVSDKASLEAWVKASASTLGGIDIVIGNVSALAVNDDEAAWQTGFDTDMMHCVRMVNAALPWLETSKDASITLVSSVSGREIDFTGPAYGAFKAALVHYAQGLAYKLAPQGIRANTVSPGNTFFEGGIWNKIETGNPELFATALGLNPTGRMATPEEIARGVVFLASPASSFTSGTNLVIDGALTKGVQL
ncbi:3-oxoacyl-[acyl-carrier-protein] reductase FabG [Roseovarius sp. A-2]|uniref:SDR family NAD(P)-dependent oxidoreductase n=1 Tax=Roseovarius sp. A-2 TaxID=1570360 RepID=UPI0009B52B35|nr:SDR family oxidoreductase [Roseovarius sp. A-2]GAW36913.1 3-oxoacyl-[acyl-carrier-protein] reductase FabG [Roseovarius sp. A-2]